MIALFPGSFDPFTTGHEVIVRRGLKLFDKIYIGVGVNSDKKYMFTTDERIARIQAVFADEPRVEAVAYSDMTIDLCHRIGAECILRGVRNAEDLAYEQTVATVNRTLDPAIETVILLSDLEHQNISSTLERERISHSNNRKTSIQ